MNKDRLPWFKCYPTKWLGALAAMKQDEGYLYFVICLRMYEVDGPCRDTLDALAIRTHMNRRRVSDLLDRLFRTGKLVRDGDGITNPFAADMLTKRKAIIDGRAQAGRAGASARWEKPKQKQTTNDGKCQTTLWQNDADVEVEVDKKKEVREESPRSLKRTRARTAFPVGWRLSDIGIKYAMGFGFTTEQIARLFEKFSNHHTAQGSLMADWTAAWRTWVTKEIEFSANRRNGNGYGGPRPLQDDSLSISKAAGRLAEKAERGEFTFGPRPRLFGALPAKDADDVQLLPPRRGA